MKPAAVGDGGKHGTLPFVEQIEINVLKVFDCLMIVTQTPAC